MLGKTDGALLEKMAGYRNRMVHFYQEISDRELYEICSRQAGDVENLLQAFLRWVKENPDKVDRSL